MPHALCRGHSHTSVKELWSQLLPHPTPVKKIYHTGWIEQKIVTIP